MNISCSTGNVIPEFQPQFETHKTDNENHSNTNATFCIGVAGVPASQASTSGRAAAVLGSGVLAVLETAAKTLPQRASATPLPIEPAPTPAPAKLTLEGFAERIEREFCEGSGISEELYRLNVRVVPDTATGPGGEVLYPIDRELNWVSKVKCGHHGYKESTRPTQFGAIITGEYGVFQVKLAFPRTDGSKTIKYETPKGNGSRAFIANIGNETRAKIAANYGVDFPENLSLSEFLKANPELSLTITEGAKKALSLLSQGFLAIALTGVNGGYRVNDALGNPLISGPELISDLLPFVGNDRTLVIAFDQDEKTDTRFKVSCAISKFGKLLQGAGCRVLVTKWEGREGKGIDDLLVGAGLEKWETAIEDSRPFAEWEILKSLEGQLTSRAAIRLRTHDLSTLEISDLPKSGIIGFYSTKGSSKTKAAAALVIPNDPTIALGHRISLMRNICDRLGLDYIGDLDQVNGDFISPHGYTSRIGLVVDSLLAIDPEKYRDRDVVIDEVCQVIRHLLTSDTCRKDGKLAALLERFTTLVKVARRVIVLDADLNDNTLKYLQALRGDGSGVYLIRNDQKSQGYGGYFIEAKDETAIVKMLRQDALNIPVGKVLMGFCTTKKMVDKLAILLQEDKPSLRILTITSENSGSPEGQEFITTPNKVLARGDYDLILCSPSVFTGVSIEIQNIIWKVYGIFPGYASTDADLSQALSRVRELVPRVIWCSEKGRSFNKISTCTFASGVKRDLEDISKVKAAILKCQLGEDSPHVDLWCQLTADHNRSMVTLRTALKVRLEWEGNHLNVIDLNPVIELKNRLADITEAINQKLWSSIVNAEIITRTQAKSLERKAGLTPEEQASLSRFYLEDFYQEEATLELVRKDRNGARRAEILQLENLLYPGLAMDRDLRVIEKMESFGAGLVALDLPTMELRRKVRERIGLQDFLDPEKTWTAEDLKPYGATIRRYKKAVKQALNFSVSPKISDTQLVHQLLSQLGIKLKCQWQTIDDKRVRVHSLNQEHWQGLRAILERREKKRQELDSTMATTGSPPPVSLYKELGGGDQPQNLTGNGLAGNLPNHTLLGASSFAGAGLAPARSFPTPPPDQPLKMAG